MNRIEITFRQLLTEKPFAEITAVDITSRCGLSRSTLYRKWAGTEDLLWAVLRPYLEDALKATIAGASEPAIQAFSRLLSLPGVGQAIRHASVAAVFIPNLRTLIASEIDRRCKGRDTETCALLIASALYSFLSADVADGDRTDKLSEVVLFIYVAVHMTPQSLTHAIRDHALSTPKGRFPAAVSAAESLASDEYIVSMIDGRPYRSLKRHLARYGMSPDEYRRCFDLPPDYPMVAPAYSQKRSAMARDQFGGIGAKDEAAMV
jgi:predicted transcriptional regulator